MKKIEVRKLLWNTAVALAAFSIAAGPALIVHADPQISNLLPVGPNNLVPGVDTGIAINANTFPDENFRKYVKDNFDTTPDDYLTLEELKAVTEIQCYGMQISSLEGIQYFK